MTILQAPFINPLTALGDTIVAGANGVLTRLAGNTTTAKQFFTQTGTGSASATQAWGTIAVGDLPNLPASIITTGQIGPAQGGTGQDCSAAAAGTLLIGTGSGLAQATLTQGTGMAISNGAGTISIGLANTAVSANSYGSASAVATFTVDAQGRLTAAATTTISITASQVSNFNTAVQTNRLDQMAAPTGSISFNSQKGINALDPTSAQDLATKNYVDTVAQGLDAKPSVLVATTANITLSGEQTIDGFTTSASRVLVKNQSTASQNGIYVSASGSWVRAVDMDTGGEFSSAFVFVEEGTVNGNTGWVCTTVGTITVGSTSVPFTQFSGAGSYTNGTGLSLTGTVFAIAAGGVGTTQLAASAVDLTTKVTGILPSANGGTGVNNAGTLTNASNTTITGGGTIALGGFTATIPATGTVGLLGTAQTWTSTQTYTAVSAITITGTAGNAIAPPTVFGVTTGAHTNLTAATTGTPLVLFDMSATETWAGGGTVASYIAMRIKLPTISATSSTTFSGMVGVQIDGFGVGTNAVTSGAVALLVVGNQQCQGTLSAKSAPQALSLAQSTLSSGIAQHVQIAGANQNGQTASTEAPQFIVDYGQTVQHATGALALQRTVIIKPATYSFVGASNLTDSATFAVQGPPAAGTNCTLVNQPSAIWAQAGQIRAGTSGTSAGNFMADPSAAPALLANGQIWSDSTRNAMVTRQNGATQTVSTILFSSTADATVASSTTETSIIGTGVGSATLPANFMVAGKVIRITVQGILSNTASPSLRIRVKFGSTFILDTGTVTLVGTLSNSHFKVSALLICRTAGASGTIMGSGDLRYDNGTTGQTEGMANTAATTADTTTSSLIDVMLTWGANSALDTATGQAVLVEALN